MSIYNDYWNEGFTDKQNFHIKSVISKLDKIGLFAVIILWIITIFTITPKFQSMFLFNKDYEGDFGDAVLGINLLNNVTWLDGDWAEIIYATVYLGSYFLPIFIYAKLYGLFKGIYLDSLIKDYRIQNLENKIEGDAKH